MFSPFHFSYHDSEGLKCLCGANRKICRYNRTALSSLNSPPLPPKAHQKNYGKKKKKNFKDEPYQTQGTFLIILWLQPVLVLLLLIHV